MIDNTLVNRPMRAQIKSVSVRSYIKNETEFPYISVSLRVIDDKGADIENYYNGAEVGFRMGYFLVNSKKNEASAWVVNSLRLVFEDWDNTIEWFGDETRHQGQWYHCILRANKTGEGYDVESLYPVNGQPYQNPAPKTDAKELGRKWNSLIAMIPSDGVAKKEAPVKKILGTPVDEIPDVPF